MEKPLMGKQILMVENEITFRSLLEDFLRKLGANVFLAENGNEAIDIIVAHKLDVIICELNLPGMSGVQLIECLFSQGNSVPILVISATEKISEVSHVLRLGVKDILLKPLKDFDELVQALLACIHPSMFVSDLEENTKFFQNWDILVQDPAAITMLLRQLQPPVHQIIANCRVNYRQLTLSEQPGLILDIAALSENELAFYCLDIAKAGDNGVLAALLLRTLFNDLLQELASGKLARLPKLSRLMKQVNRLLCQANLEGPFPLLIGYYQQTSKNLKLISAGLEATLKTNKEKIALNEGKSLGISGNAHFKQLSQYCSAWQCYVSGMGGELKLMLSSI